MSALEDLSSLLNGLPNASLLTDGMKNDALASALLPDSSGVWPGETGYVSTSDIYFAAIRLVGFLQAQPVVRSSSSEGTSVSVDAPKWDGLLAYYRGLSPIVQATCSDVLTKVLIPDGPHVYPTDMTHGGDYYDDVDTDLG